MVYLASDHAGFELKEKLKEFLGVLGYEVKDFGAYEYNKDDDFPDFIIPAIRALKEDLEKGIDSKAVIFGFSGQGEAMCANRFIGVRAAVFYGGKEDIVRLSREHNNSNVLSLGAGFLSEEEAKSAVKLWFETCFPNVEDENSPRHKRRIDKMDLI